MPKPTKDEIRRGKHERIKKLLDELRPKLQPPKELWRGDILYRHESVKPVEG